MDFNIHEQEYTLASGRKFGADCGVIGIGGDGDFGFAVCGGYDSEVTTHEFTPDERREIADYMISEWQKFRALDDGKR